MSMGLGHNYMVEMIKSYNCVDLDDLAFVLKDIKELFGDFISTGKYFIELHPDLNLYDNVLRHYRVWVVTIVSDPLKKGNSKK